MDRLRNLAAAIALLGAVSCSRQDRELQQHQETMASLSGSTTAIVNAWLGGSVSGTYTSTALEDVLMMVEQDRYALAVSPKLLIDQRGAAIADSAAQLSQRLAAILSAVQQANSTAARAQVAAIPFQKPS
jgi:hypothetical protein